VFDLMEEHPACELPFHAYLEMLSLLAPRYYSISSSPSVEPSRCSLTAAVVEGPASSGRGVYKGICSNYLAGRRAGETIHATVRETKAGFRLPDDASVPIIMIGPGTGLAPFRGFLQEREATGAGGRNWLVFGHRNYTHDFLYQLEMQDWLKSSLLTRLDVAFSRDQPEKRYVQNALWEARGDLHAWLKDGAALYVCGDANAMAKDVHAMLLRILADQGRQDEAAAKAELDAIRRDGRYLRDVY
jgi:sulfite reductase alpha subunit-like flavoprotein